MLHRLGESQGTPLPLPLLTPFERLFRTQLQVVTLHTDSAAARATEAQGAAAMTLGTRIFFAPGRFQPETPAGQALLAHELTHVVQQRTSPQRLALKSLGSPSPIDATASADEDEAETIEQRVLGLATAGAFAAQPRPLVTRTPASAALVAGMESGGLDRPALGTDAFPALARFSIERAPDGAPQGGGGGQGPLGGSAAMALVGGDTPGGGLPASDVDLIADRVYSLLKDRLAIERERRGRWL